MVDRREDEREREREERKIEREREETGAAWKGCTDVSGGGGAGGNVVY